MKVVQAHEVKAALMRYSLFERSHIAAVTEGLNGADVLSITGAKLAIEYEVKVSKSDLDKELAAIRYATMTMKEGKQLAPITNGPEQEQLNFEFAELHKKSGGWSKIGKHQEYVDPKAYLEQRGGLMMAGYRYVPNYFNIVVPNKLVPYAIDQLQGTGYGVIAFDGCRQEGQHLGYHFQGQWFEYENKPDGASWMRGAPCSPDGCIREIAVKSNARKIHAEPVADRIVLAMLHRAVIENIRMLGELVRLKVDVNALHQQDNPRY